MEKYIAKNNQSAAGAGGLDIIRGKTVVELSRDIKLLLNSRCNNINNNEKNEKKNNKIK